MISKKARVISSMPFPEQLATPFAQERGKLLKERRHFLLVSLLCPDDSVYEHLYPSIPDGMEEKE